CRPTACLRQRQTARRAERILAPETETGEGAQTSMSSTRYGGRRLRGLLALVVGTVFGAAPPIRGDAPQAPVDAARGRPSVVADEVLVKFRPGAAASDVAVAHRQAGAQTVRQVPGLGVSVVQAHGAMAQALAAYQHNPNVEYAEPNGVAYP